MVCLVKVKQPSALHTHLPEGRPLLLRLRHAVAVLAIRLEGVGRAQFVERLERHPRGIPEAHGAVLVAERNTRFRVQNSSTPMTSQKVDASTSVFEWLWPGVR